MENLFNVFYIFFVRVCQPSNGAEGFSNHKIDERIKIAATMLHAVNNCVQHVGPIKRKILY